jgi:uncharacterized membrane protein
MLELSEIATILTVIVALISIFLYLLRLTKWWQRRKKEKPTKFLQPLPSVITSKAIKARGFYDDILKKTCRFPYKTTKRGRGNIKSYFRR